jgi:hypothetical protein
MRPIPKKRNSGRAACLLIVFALLAAFALLLIGILVSIRREDAVKEKELAAEQKKADDERNQKKQALMAPLEHLTSSTVNLEVQSYTELLRRIGLPADKCEPSRPNTTSCTFAGGRIDAEVFNQKDGSFGDRLVSIDEWRDGGAQAAEGPIWRGVPPRDWEKHVRICGLALGDQVPPSAAVNNDTFFSYRCGQWDLALFTDPGTRTIIRIAASNRTFWSIPF